MTKFARKPEALESSWRGAAQRLANNCVKDLDSVAEDGLQGHLVETLLFIVTFREKIISCRG